MPGMAPCLLSGELLAIFKHPSLTPLGQPSCSEQGGCSPPPPPVLPAVISVPSAQLSLHSPPTLLLMHGLALCTFALASPLNLNCGVCRVGPGPASPGPASHSSIPCGSAPFGEQCCWVQGVKEGGGQLTALELENCLHW